MKRDNHILHLALALDENYLIPFQVLLHSLFESNAPRRLRIHAIVTGLPDAQKTAISHAVQHKGAVIRFYQVEESLIRDFAVTNEARYTRAVYYRLFFPHLVDESITRLLYLDIDMIILADLSELFATSFHPYPIAAAPEMQTIRPDLGITLPGAYFNSGVMLIDTAAWRREEITEKAIRFLKSFPEKAPYHDQDALNAELIDNWYRIDTRYNCISQDLPKAWWSDQSDYRYLFSARNRSAMIRRELDNYLTGIVVVHYNYPVKPWAPGANHPLRYLHNDHFIRWGNTATGKKMLTASAIHLLRYLVLKAAADQENDPESRIALAFSLHLRWIIPMWKEEGKEIVTARLAEHFGETAVSAADDISGALKAEYQRNRSFLLACYRSILTGEAPSRWARHWAGLSGVELHLAPAIIDTELGIAGAARVLLFCFLTTLLLKEEQTKPA